MIGIVAVVEVGEGVLSHSVDLPPLMICVVTEMHILDALDYIIHHEHGLCSLGGDW